MHYLTFGRHKGEPLSAVPTGYLQWLWNEGVSRPWWLRGAVEAELWRRSAGSRRRTEQTQQQRPESGGAVARLTEPAVREAIRRAFNKMALLHHPDRNGSGSEIAMKALNGAKQLLEEALFGGST